MDQGEKGLINRSPERRSGFEMMLGVHGSIIVETSCCGDEDKASC